MTRVYPLPPVSLRRRWAAYLWDHQAWQQRQLDPAQLAAPAVVFAPHMDDETLGLGGTLIRKRRAGARMKIAFLTDGSASHASHTSGEALAELRRAEALSALSRLGFARNQLEFFDLPDGRLGSCRAQAAEKAAWLLARQQPEQVFIPYYRDPPSDHAVTNQVIISVLRQLGYTGLILEYPIWYWNHWPWVSLRPQWKRKTLQVLQNTLAFWFGLGLRREFQRSVLITAVAPLKRAALDCYVSQMQVPPTDPGWQTLPRVSQGEFLARFFQDYEVFRVWRLPAQEKQG